MAMNVNDMAKEVGLPLETWFVSRFGLIPELVNREILEGELCFGIFINGSSFIQHCWVVDGNTIYDPVRWAIENREPYLFVGQVGVNKEYDLDGQHYRESTRNIVPEFDPSLQSFHVETGTIESDMFVRNFFDKPTDRLSRNQVEWLAQVPSNELGQYEKAVHDWIEGVGLGDQIKR